MANMKTVRMLSAEEQSISEYIKKGELVLDISKTEALAKGSLIGSVCYSEKVSDPKVSHNKICSSNSPDTLHSPQSYSMEVI